MIMIGTNVSGYRMNNGDLNRIVSLKEELLRLDWPHELTESKEPVDESTKKVIKAYLQKRIEEIEHHGC